MKKNFLILCLYFFCGSIFAQNSLNEKIQAVLHDFKEKNRIGAISMALSFPDEAAPRLFNTGSISAENETPVHMGNLFQTGSITKSFISAAILKLQEKGLLSIHDNLGQWLPEYAAFGNISIQQLLNHTSGIYNFTDSEKFRMYLFQNQGKKIEAEELIHFAAVESPYFNPGEGWHYSNTGYVLLGKILEKASGKKAHEVIEDLFLKNEAYNLVNSAFIPHQYPEATEKRMVHGYYQLFPGQAVDITAVSMSWMNTAGGMVSNSYDLVRWVRALFSGQILNTESFHAFTSLVSLRNGQPLQEPNASDFQAYGLGIQAYKSSFESMGIIWWHSGSTLGYKSLMMWLPRQKIAMAITFNQVMAGQENAPFSPETELPQKLLELLE